MRFKKRELLLSVLVGTGIHLLNSLRERLPDNMDDIKGKVRDTYDTASDRLSRATDALRGKEDSQVLGRVRRSADRSWHRRRNWRPYRTC
jgi:hypothetical protein